MQSILMLLVCTTCICAILHTHLIQGASHTKQHQPSSYNNYFITKQKVKGIIFVFTVILSKNIQK